MSPSILDIDEIMRLVLLFCDAPSLARLARTNRWFTEPALDLLWAELRSFKHLLRLLPSELITWHQMDPPGAGLRPMVNHLIIPRNWTRFTYYVQRVRSWAEDDLTYIDEPVVDHIAFGRLPGFIIPNLTHIELSASSVSGVHLQTLILCPALQSVSVRNLNPVQAATRAMHTFFRTLADRAPMLRNLLVQWGDGGMISTQFKDGLADLYEAGVAHLESVQLLSPMCIDANALLLLSRLQNLTTLYLNLMDVTPEHRLSWRIASQDEAFPALQNLFLTGSLVELQNMMRCCKSPQRILSLGLSIRQFPKARELQQLFDVVATQYTNLEVLQLSMPRLELDDVELTLAIRLFDVSPDEYQLDMSVLQPLLSLRSLAAVSIEPGLPLQLTDLDLHNIGVAWPNIKSLNLCPDPFCLRTRNWRPTASIQGLLALVTQCTVIKELGLNLDFTALIAEELIADCALSSRSITRLDVGRSWMVNPAYVAALLSGAFPALHDLQWRGKEDPPTNTLQLQGSIGNSHEWKQVADFLPVFRAVRTNERLLRSTADTDRVQPCIVRAGPVVTRCSSASGAAMSMNVD